MEWLSQNWLWVALGAVMVAMHVFGHGGHNHVPAGEKTDEDKPADHRQ